MARVTYPPTLLGGNLCHLVKRITLMQNTRATSWYSKDSCEFALTSIFACSTVNFEDPRKAKIQGSLRFTLTFQSSYAFSFAYPLVVLRFAPLLTAPELIQLTMKFRLICCHQTYSQPIPLRLPLSVASQRVEHRFAQLIRTQMLTVQLALMWSESYQATKCKHCSIRFLRYPEWQLKLNQL